VIRVVSAWVRCCGESICRMEEVAVV
jgi:hypothetical protein